ncbi:hypothetical protein B0H16DRAFT_574409 [Mycena metata]|uniref:Uncharacterized protein n=1 Tax=Mycena metata TaxID=1033252 RepID=A0AAD7NHR5_9AGAR|nr:hypothetical protein B0H16DRAFT_574409 [Mycena metata]
MKRDLRSRLLTNIVQLSLISSQNDSQSTAALEYALTGIDTGSLALIGGLTEEDIQRFAQSSTLMLDINRLISEETNAILRLIANYWDSSSSDSDGTTGSSSRDLVHDMQTRLEKIKGLDADGDPASERIVRLLQRVHEIHPRLQQRLTYALERFPTEMESRSAANDDLLAMAIEASLVKISLVRAQALDLVYNYHSQKNPELHMRHALSAAHTKLKDDEREMEEEERKLDRELAQYQTLLDMVDGGGSGGFRQIVADTARVEKETEECKKDLRRLGWTGED